MNVEPFTEQAAWDELVLQHGGHPLQLWGWGEVKARHNWQVERVVIKDGTTEVGAAQLLIRRLPWPFRALVYIPRGPVVGEGDRASLLAALTDYVKRRYHPVTLTIEPDWREVPDLKGWCPSPNDILLAHTLVLDLTKTEDELLEGMSKKTRQYIRKSEKEQLSVRHLKSRDELDACLDIYKQTAARAQFALHDDQYYYDIFAQLGEHSPVFAVFQDETPVAFVWLAISQTTAFELYGGMTEEGSRLRANYMLKWHAIRQMKEWGIDTYDMNGLLNDGVSTFKRGFASHEDEWIGTYERPMSPLYGLWTKGLPFLKQIMHRIKPR